MRHATPLRALALLTALLAVVVVAAGCGSDAGSGSSGEARALLERALDRERAVRSGELELSMRADLQGASWLRGPLVLSLAGPFRSGGARKAPSLDWDVHFNGLGQKFAGGVVSTGDDAFLRFRGRAYELGKDSFARLARRLGVGQRGRTGLVGLDPASWLKDAKVTGGERIGGEPTRKVTGSVDVHRAVRDVVSVLESPAVRERLRRKGLESPTLHRFTDRELKRIEDAIEGIDVELNVDRADVLRRFLARIDFDGRRGGADADVKGRLTFEYVLRRVGTNAVIRAPSNARPLGELLGGFGLGGLGLGLDGRHD